MIDELKSYEPENPVFILWRTAKLTRAEVAAKIRYYRERIDNMKV